MTINNTTLIVLGIIAYIMVPILLLFDAPFYWVMFSAIFSIYSIVTMNYFAMIDDSKKSQHVNGTQTERSLAEAALIEGVAFSQDGSFFCIFNPSIGTVDLFIMTRRWNYEELRSGEH